MVEKRRFQNIRESKITKGFLEAGRYALAILAGAALIHYDAGFFDQVGTVATDFGTGAMDFFGGAYHIGSDFVGTSFKDAMTFGSQHPLLSGIIDVSAGAGLGTLGKGAVDRRRVTKANATK